MMGAASCFVWVCLGACAWCGPVGSRAVVVWVLMAFVRWIRPQPAVNVRKSFPRLLVRRLGPWSRGSTRSFESRAIRPDLVLARIEI